MYCSPPGFSVLRILQERKLEWVAISSSRGSSRPRSWTQVSCTVGRFFTIWATREALTDLNHILYEIYIYLQMCVGAHKALLGSATGHFRPVFPSFSCAASATLTLFLLLNPACCSTFSAREQPFLLFRMIFSPIFSFSSFKSQLKLKCCL